VIACVQSHTFKFFNAEKEGVRRRGSGKLGEVFRVKVEVFTVRQAAIETPTMNGCAQFFAGWIMRFGNPPYLFTFPLSERAPEPPNPTTII
jgi:hypothetical protein